MTPADSHSVAPDMIVRVVEAELETLTQVLEMLDIEHEALMGNDAERLEQAVAAKQNAISAHLQSRTYFHCMAARHSAKIREIRWIQ